MHKYIRLVLMLTILGVWLGFPLGQAAAVAGILLTKTAGTDNATLGDTVVYTYTITNTTTDNCFEAKLIDNKIGQINIPSQLEAGDNVTVTASHVVASADYADNATQLTNIATFTGSLSSGENVTVTASESVALNRTSSLQVGMSAGVSSASVGDNITYTYTVTNSGQSALSALALTDSKLGAVTLNSATLASGASLTATKIYTVLSSDLPGPLSSSSTATATSSTGAAVTATSANVTVTLNQTSSLQVGMSAGVSSASVGDNITYTYTVTNSGQSALSALALTDSKLGAVTLNSATLASGASLTATKIYTVLSSDLPGPLSSSSTATATSSTGAAVTATSANVTVTLSRTSSLQVTKLADKNVAAEGDVITYTYSVSNNGDVEIKDIVLTDDPLGNIPLASGNTTVSSLAPGAQVTATATYKVVLADLRAGSVKNTAWATGTDVNGNAVTSNTVEVKVSTNGFLNWLTKAGILRASGVMGKGIDRAPGLQKPFNPNSQAAQHAGKKDGKGNLGQNENQTISGSAGQNQEQNKSQQMSGNSVQNQEQNNNQVINSGSQQNREQEMNGNQHQNGNQDKDKDKGKGKGQGKNNK